MYKTSSPLKRLAVTTLDVISFILIVVIILSIAAGVMYFTEQALRFEDISYFLENPQYFLQGAELGIFGFFSEPIHISLFDFGYIVLFPSMTIVGATLGAILFAYLMYFVIVPAIGPNQTIGRLITGSKIVTLEGEKPGIGKIFVREVIGNHILSIAVVGILANLFLVFSDTNKTLSDTLAKTALVDKEILKSTKILSKIKDNSDDSDENSENQKKKEKKVKEKKNKKSDDENMPEVESKAENITKLDAEDIIL